MGELEHCPLNSSSLPLFRVEGIGLFSDEAQQLL